MAKNLVVEGTEWGDLGLQLDAWFQPGGKVFLEFGVDRDLNVEELTAIQEALLKEGVPLVSPVQIGSGVWENTIRLGLQNPRGFAVAPLLAGAIILAIGAVGVGSILGWRIGRLLERHFLPILIVGSAVTLGVLMTGRK